MDCNENNKVSGHVPTRGNMAHGSTVGSSSPPHGNRIGMNKHIIQIDSSSPDSSVIYKSTKNVDGKKKKGYPVPKTYTRNDGKRVKLKTLSYLLYD